MTRARSLSDRRQPTTQFGGGWEHVWGLCIVGFVFGWLISPYVWPR